MESIQLNIKGMKCGGCVSTVEKILNNSDGIENVSVNLLTESAYFEITQKHIEIESVLENLKENGIPSKIYINDFSKKINKVNQGSPHIVDILNAKKIALVINTGGGNSEAQLSDAVALRRATLANKVPYCTNMSTAKVCLEGIKSLKLKDISVTSLQDL